MKYEIFTKNLIIAKIYENKSNQLKAMYYSVNNYSTECFEVIDKITDIYIEKIKSKDFNFEEIEKIANNYLSFKDIILLHYSLFKNDLLSETDEDKILSFFSLLYTGIISIDYSLYNRKIKLFIDLKTFNLLDKDKVINFYRKVKNIISPTNNYKIEIKEINNLYLPSELIDEIIYIANTSFKNNPSASRSITILKANAM